MEQTLTNEQLKEIYVTQFQKCALAAWNLAIFLNENDVDLSSLPDEVKNSLEFMKALRESVVAEATDNV